ncbi:MAG: site-specific integrase [Anaerolineaceae bacterium]|nr:site-specific integrase [Anaerolineaceae bacterium]
MGEIIGLKWEDLDMKSRILQIRRQVQRVTGKGLIYCEPKSSSSRRVVILGATAIEKLRTEFKQLQIQPQIAGNNWVENDLIFPNSLGKPREHSRLLKEFKEILPLAGLPLIRFHDLRHTAATLMLQQGIHPKVVQEMLGHSDINLTLTTYSHILPTMQLEAANKMDEIVTMIEISKEIDNNVSKE